MLLLSGGHHHNGITISQFQAIYNKCLLILHYKFYIFGIQLDLLDTLFFGLLTYLIWYGIFYFFDHR